MSKLIMLFLLTSSICFSQQISSENLSFHFVFAKKFAGTRVGYQWVEVAENEKKIHVKLKMKTISGEKEDIDPNKFSLVSDTAKERIRPIEIKHNYAVNFPYLIKFKTNNKAINSRAKFKPDIKDTFYEFSIQDYKDISPCINIGTKKKPQLVYTYFDHKKLKAVPIHLMFSVSKGFEKGKIFYGDKSIAQFEL